MLKMRPTKVVPKPSGLPIRHSSLPVSKPKAKLPLTKEEVLNVSSSSE